MLQKYTPSHIHTFPHEDAPTERPFPHEDAPTESPLWPTLITSLTHTYTYVYSQTDTDL